MAAGERGDVCDLIQNCSTPDLVFYRSRPSLLYIGSDEGASMQTERQGR
jgi:hypothetical protein